MNVARNEQSEGGEVLVLQRRRRETGPRLHRYPGAQSSPSVKKHLFLRVSQQLYKHIMISNPRAWYLF